MTLLSQFDRLNTFLDTLARLSPAERRDALANEILECGGTWTIPPAHDDLAGTALCEISLHGIAALGLTEDQAIRHWIDLASHYRVPFPQPRNHAEEIANARAIAERGL